MGTAKHHVSKYKPVKRRRGYFLDLSMISPEMSFEERLRGLEVVNDPALETVRINNGRSRAKMYGQIWNETYLEYIRNKIANDDLTTDEWNRYQACAAMNICYLDIDIDIQDNDAKDVTMIALATIYGNTFKAVLNDHHYEVADDYFFIPCAYPPTDDGLCHAGAHILLILTRNINLIDRLSCYNDTKQRIMSNHIERLASAGLNVTTDNYGRVFDIGPLRSMLALLPFARKVGSTRNYRLVTTISVPRAEMLVIPRVHEVNVDNDTVEDDIDESLNLDFTPTPEAFTVFQDTPYKSFIPLNMFALIDALRFLHIKHPFWKLLHDHESRYRQIIKPIFDFIALSMFAMRPRKVAEIHKQICSAVAQKFMPLIAYTNPPDDKGNTLQQVTTAIANVIHRPYISKGDYSMFADPEIAEYFDCYRELKTRKQVFAHICSKLESKIGDKTEIAQMAARILLKLERCRDLGQRIINAFSVFIDMIMTGMTDELVPFKNVMVMTYNVDIRGDAYDVNFDEYNASPNSDVFNQYNTMMSTLVRVFMCNEYYNSALSPKEAIRRTLSAFCSAYVRIIQEGPDEITLIYNIRQTPDLQQLPYNQWVVDLKASHSIRFLTRLYHRYIATELRSDHKASFINDYIMLLRMTDAAKPNPRDTIVPYDNIMQDMKTLNNNIISSAYCNHSDPIKWDVCKDCPYFPMRSGWLEFVLDDYKYASIGLKRGDTYFIKNNYDHYMIAYTNVPYTEDYDYTCKPFKDVSKMIMETFPRTSIREYQLMMYGPCLHAIGARDQIHQQYGTGGEGKSLFNNFILTLFGCNQDLINVVNFRDKVLSIPYSLGATLSPEALLQSKKNGHDSGGIADLINRRFVTVQEPDTMGNGTIMNVAAGKKLTGDATLSARPIWKESISFLPRVYITIQTNIPLGYSEDTDAVTRRYAVIPFEAKFITAAMRGSVAANLPNVHDADPLLAESTRNDPNYWEALFRYLLPYAQNFLKKGYKALSDVPKPDIIQRYTTISRNKSVGLLGWFAQNFDIHKYSFMSVKEIIDMIGICDRNERATGGSSIFDERLTRASQSVREDEICQMLTAKFCNLYLYRLRDECWEGYDPSKSEEEQRWTGRLVDYITIDGQQVYYQQELNAMKNVYDDTTIRRFFYPFPLHNINDIPGATSDGCRQGVYVFDHCFKSMITQTTQSSEIL